MSSTDAMSTVSSIIFLDHDEYDCMAPEAATIHLVEDVAVVVDLVSDASCSDACEFEFDSEAESEADSEDSDSLPVEPVVVATVEPVADADAAAGPDWPPLPLSLYYEDRLAFYDARGALDRIGYQSAPPDGYRSAPSDDDDDASDSTQPWPTHMPVELGVVFNARVSVSIVVQTGLEPMDAD